MQHSEKIEEITDGIKRYINTNIEIIKLETTERASVAGSTLISNVIIGAMIFLTITIISIGLGFLFSELLGNTYGGFLIIAGFYLLLTIIVIVFRKKHIEQPLRDIIIRMILSTDDN